MDLEGSSFCPEPSTGIPLVPLIVTASSPSQTRRWQVLMASTGMRVRRPDDELQNHELPAIHVHVEDAEVWLTWVRPSEDLTTLRDSLKRWWWEAQDWVERTGNTPHSVARFELHQRLLAGLYDRGFEPIGRTGNVHWLEFQDKDWRTIADVVALVVRRVSSGESLD